MTTDTLERPIDTEGFTLSRIKEGDMAHAMITLSRQYSRPKDAVIRELSTNALESQRAAGYTGPVEVTLPGDTHPFLTVTDHGLGLGLDDIVNVFGDYADSPKRHAGQATPNYGVGSKSPFAVADSYTVTAIKDGVRREVLFARLPDGNPGYKIISTSDTNEANGVTVSVPVKDDYLEHGEWRAAARQVFYWWEEDTFRVHGDDAVTGRSSTEIFVRTYRREATASISTDSVLSIPKESPHRDNRITVRTGTTGHSVPSRFFDRLGLSLVGLDNLVVEMPQDLIKIAPNRESIEDTESNRELVYGALRDWAANLTSTYLVKLEAATNSYNLFRAWDEASETERALTNTRDFFRVGRRYGKEVRIELAHTWYPQDRRRTKEDYLHVAALGEAMGGRCLELGELDSKASDIIARWRSANGMLPVYVFASKEDVRPLIDPDEIEWVTLEDLKVETPSKKAKPVLPLTDADIVQRIWRRRYFNQPPSRYAVTIGEVKERLSAGLPLIIGATKDYEDLDINYRQVVAIARGPRKTEAIEKAVGQQSSTPQEHLLGKYLTETKDLDDEQKQVIVERATIPRTVIQRAQWLAAKDKLNADNEWVSRYPEAVLEAIKPLIDLKEGLDPLYVQLPGMPEPRLGIEFKYTIALLSEISGPSEMLLKMALRADKMAAGDRKRKLKAAGTK